MLFERAGPSRLMLHDDAPHDGLLALQLGERRDIVPHLFVHRFGGAQIAESCGRNGRRKARENAQRNPEQKIPPPFINVALFRVSSLIGIRIGHIDVSLESEVRSQKSEIVELLSLTPDIRLSSLDFSSPSPQNSFLLSIGILS